MEISVKNKVGTKRKNVFKILSRIMTALLLVFFVFVVVLLFTQQKQGQQKSIFGHYMFNVVTDSMEPSIIVGDVILAKEYEGQTLKKGDIITFIAPSGSLKGHPITHRIVNIVKSADGTIDYLKTAGDNTYGKDEVNIDDWELDENNVIALYTKTLALLGKFRTFLFSPLGYIVLIALPLILVAVMIIIGFFKDKSKLEIEKVKQEIKQSNTNISIENLSNEDKKLILEEYLNSNNNNLDDSTPSDIVCTGDNSGENNIIIQELDNRENPETYEASKAKIDNSDNSKNDIVN